MEQEEIPEDERELILAEVQVKTTSFLSLISSVKSQAFKWDNFDKLDKTAQVSTIPESSYESLELQEVETVSSHPHALTKRPDNQHQSWACDRISGSMVCRGGIHTFKTGKQGWRCNDCDFDLCISCMKISRYLENRANPPKKELTAAESDQKEEKEVSIDELLKQSDDTEIEFIFNQKQVEHITTFEQISKMQPLEKEKKENA